MRRFQGRTDIPLDDEGRAQAQALARYLAPERFDLCVASDLSRAASTATAIGAACGVTVEFEPRLREMRFGSWEGLTWDEIVARTPALAHAPARAPLVYLPADGESFDEVSARVAPVIAEVRARLGPGGRALIVSHAGVMHAILGIALAEPEESALGITFRPASIMRLEGDGTIPWLLTSVNEIAPPLADSAASPA